MSTMCAVFQIGTDVEFPMDVVKRWSGSDFPSLGRPDDVRELLNRLIADAGIDTRFRDDESGVLLPDGVSSVRFHVHDGLVRMILAGRPTSELLRVLCGHGSEVGWRVFDAGSETEYTLDDFTD